MRPPPDILESHEIEHAEVITVSERGDGRQRILKLTHHGTRMVLKFYGRKRGRLRTLVRQFGSLAILGKSSILAKARFRTEREALKLWRREGFDVPEILLIQLPKEENRLCLALEWINGPTLSQVIQDADSSLEEKCKIAESFAESLGARHQRALNLRESRLLVEHPTLNHVFLSDRGLVFFDLEIVFTRNADLERIIRRELIGYLSAMAKNSGSQFSSILDRWVKAYPDHQRLIQLLKDLKKYGTVPALKGLEYFSMLCPSKERYKERKIIIEVLGTALGCGETDR